MIELKQFVPTRHYPQFNEPFPTMFGDIITHPTSYEDLNRWIERTPEAIAIIEAIRTDLQSDGIFFEPIKQKGKGKVQTSTRLEEAEEFYEKNFFKEERGKAILDELIYGDGYLFIGKKFTSQQIKEARSIASVKAYRQLFGNTEIKSEFKNINPDEVSDFLHC